MEKYSTLVKILDVLRNEAPAGYKRYYPLDNEVEKLNQARARAYIHLFLKVKFGLLDFSEREKYITDDKQDGGIDGYYPDQENKKFYFLQSKFRITEKNYNEKEIAFEELLQMDVPRILEGEVCDEHNIAYNDKILNMQAEMKKISDIGRWKHEIFIIANLNSSISPS